jgi:Lysyl oxidase
MFRRTQLAVLGLLLALVLIASATPTGAATDKLPDLAMARLQAIQIENTADGRQLLRFSAIIVNVGVGAFELAAQRSSTSTPWSGQQVIFDDAGGSRSVPTLAQFIFGGDGHNHWHVKDLETYELVRSDNGVKVGTGVKSGFCFFDNYRYKLTLPGAPQSAVYTRVGCGKVGSLSLKTGLSLGWGDIYTWRLPDQYIDITGLTPGRYRLWATADPAGWFQEGSEANNATWAELQLTGTGVTVLSRAPNP